MVQAAALPGRRTGAREEGVFTIGPRPSSPSSSAARCTAFTVRPRRQACLAGPGDTALHCTTTGITASTKKGHGAPFDEDQYGAHPPSTGAVPRLAGTTACLTPRTLVACNVLKL